MASVPSRVKMLKLSVSPATIKYGRLARADFTPPDMKMTGRTGSTHGETPAMRPPRRPIRITQIRGSLRCELRCATSVFQLSVGAIQCSRGSSRAHFSVP